MDRPAARARLERMVAAGSQPALSAGDLDDLRVIATRPDADGLVEGDDGWVPTFDLNAAAAEGWRWKAAKAAELVNFSADGASVSMAQLRDACVSQAEAYEGKADGGPGGGGIGTMTVGSGASDPYDYAERQVFNLT